VHISNLVAQKFIAIYKYAPIISTQSLWVIIQTGFANLDFAGSALHGFLEDAAACFAEQFLSNDLFDKPL